MNLSGVKQLFTSLFQAANHDFCPNLNQYVYWMKKPIGWVVGGCLFSVLIGLFVGPQGYVLAFAFLALMILGLVWPWISMKGIRCSLDLPYGQLNENEPAKLVLKISNFWPIPVFGMIIEGDFLQDIDAKEEPVAFSLKRVPALSVTEFPIEVVPRRRGLMPCGEVRVKNGFPLGLADVAKPIEHVNKSLVWPDCESLEGSPPAEGSHFNLFGSMSDRSGNDGETIGVRCYREGDRLRNIHWAQTVRSQRLMVRERQTPSSTSATVLLDLSSENHKGDGVSSSYEWAIRIAASVCLQLHKTRSRVQLVCLGLAAEETHTIGNQRGIDLLMDFLSSLPTLKTQQETFVPQTLRTTSDSWSASGQNFFVCTSKSSLGTLAGGDIQPILIQLDGFENDDNFSSKSPSSAPVLPEGMVVTSPDLVPSQLGSSWRKSFGHATS